MADHRTRDAIAADYQAARDRGDAAAMRRYQNEEACFVLLAILERQDRRPTSTRRPGAVGGSTLTKSSKTYAGQDAPSGSGSRASPDGRSAD